MDVFGRQFNEMEVIFELVGVAALNIHKRGGRTRIKAGVNSYLIDCNFKKTCLLTYIHPFLLRDNKLYSEEKTAALRIKPDKVSLQQDSTENEYKH